MNSAEWMVRYRRFLKRRNYSVHTVKNYLNILGQFSLWLKMPIEEVTYKEIGTYTDHLLRKRQKPKTINCHLGTIRAFYDIFTTKRGCR
jgi:site-specific recombinase XerD